MCGPACLRATLDPAFDTAAFVRTHYAKYEYRIPMRNGKRKPTPLPPGKMVSVNSEMPDVNHTFRTGHRIMVQVQSSWFPLVDCNPQTFVDIPSAKPQDFVKATETIYRNAGAASGIEVLVMPGTASEGAPK
jgi:hypothetical protein